MALAAFSGLPGLLAAFEAREAQSVTEVVALTASQSDHPKAPQNTPRKLPGIAPGFAP